MAHGTCSNCGRTVGRLTRGLCDRDYRRLSRTGNPGPAKSLTVRGDLGAHLAAKVDQSGGPDACHPWIMLPDPGGYGRIKIAGKSYPVHVLAWEVANDLPVPEGMELDHECHNRAVREGSCQPGVCPHRRCCNPSHLVPRTKAGHAAATEGQERKRDFVGRCKLTPAQVPEIRAALSAGQTLRRVAGKYGVSVKTISDIKHCRTWAWVRGYQAPTRIDLS